MGLVSKLSKWPPLILTFFFLSIEDFKLPTYSTISETWKEVTKFKPGFFEGEAIKGLISVIKPDIGELCDSFVRKRALVKYQS